MALTLWAINNGSYADVPVSKALAFEAEFLSFVRTQHPEVLDAINASGAMSEESEKSIDRSHEIFQIFLRLPSISIEMKGV